MLRTTAELARISGLSKTTVLRRLYVNGVRSNRIPAYPAHWPHHAIKVVRRPLKRGRPKKGVGDAVR